MSGPSGSDRVLRWEALLNARDLGGLPADAGSVARGAIVRADSLHRLTDAGRAALVAYGIRTVIDMRTPAEVVERPYSLDGLPGVSLAHMAQQTDEMWQAARGLARVGFDVLMLDLARSRFARIAEAIAGAPEGGVVIHCAAGKDRSGLMTMLLLDLVGTPPDVIAADYALTAIGLAPLFDELIAKADDDARRARLREEARSRPEVMVRVHGTMRTRYGSAEAYLRSGGASDETITILRGRLLGASRTT